MALFYDQAQRSDLFNFSVDETAKGYLLDTARWTKFISIVAFVLMALLLVAGTFGSFYLNNYSSRLGASFSSGMMWVVYAVIAVLYFFPSFYLYKFSVQIKPALLTANQEGFNKALSSLRNCFRFIGIITLVLLGIYALIFVFAIIGLAMR